MSVYSETITPDGSQRAELYPIKNKTCPPPIMSACGGRNHRNGNQILPGEFTLADLKRACPAVSHDMASKVLRNLRRNGDDVECPWVVGRAHAGE